MKVVRFAAATAADEVVGELGLATVATTPLTRLSGGQRRLACFAAALAADRPVLLLYDTKSGHSGGKPFRKVVEDLSLEIAFLFWQLGMDPNTDL